MGKIFAGIGYIMYIDWLIRKDTDGLKDASLSQQTDTNSKIIT